MIPGDGLALVIVTTHNRAGMLPDAVGSALAQEYPRTRVAVVDDGSTDGTEEVCRAFREKHPGRFVYVRKENGGCASARNRGLDLVDDGVSYVCFLDDDDRFLPGKIEREVALLGAHPEADFTYSDSIVFDELTGREERRRAAAAGCPERFAIEHFLTNEAKSSAILYRARAVRGRRFREDLRHDEDSEFLQRVAIACRGVYAPEPGCRVRWHAGSKSRDFAGIHKAVLRASAGILAEHPAFHRAHRELADRRIVRIRRDLFEELCLAGRWEEAREHASGAAERGVLSCRLGILVRLLRKGRSWTGEGR